MALTLYFLRHGETEASLIGRYSGTTDVNLTPTGEQMAREFAEAYQTLPWVAVFCSPLKRTMATAQPLCDATGLPLNLRDGLAEIAYGRWEEKTPTEVDREFHDDYVRWLADPGWNAPTGGEKGIEIARRSAAVLTEIEQIYADGPVLIVSHKATIRIMLCSLLGIDVGRFRDRIGMPVASVSIVALQEHGPLLKVMGDRCHLSAALRDKEGH